MLLLSISGASLLAVSTGVAWLIALGCVLVGFKLLLMCLGVRFIPNDRVGIVEKLWSRKGSVDQGRIIAHRRRGGLPGRPAARRHALRPLAWQYRIHKVPLVTVPQGKIGYVYARDGEPLTPSQTLGRVVDCNNFQDAARVPRRAAADDEATRRPARPPAGDPARRRVRDQPRRCSSSSPRTRVYRLNVEARSELQKLVELAERADASSSGFNPVVIGEHDRRRSTRSIPSKRDRRSTPSASSPSTTARASSPGEIIAPAVGNDPADANYHNNFQDPEAFLARRRPARAAVRPADRRHLLHQPLVRHGRDDRPRRSCRSATSAWSSATTARSGKDVSGDAFRHGERVARGERGVWERPLGPGKYPFNTYAGQHHPRADDQLRAALGHRQDRGAPLRREPQVASTS